MRILVVEDEPKVASFIKRGLEQAQNVVDIASTAAEADYLVSVQDYDLLILDCMLPDEDGRKLCRRLRARGVDLPVLILTAKDSTADKVLGLDSGADDYLTKPFDFTELLARVRALGRRRGRPLLQPIAIADLTIDPVTRRVTRGGQVIALTPKEYALLELLARRVGQVVTRAEIIEQVWDMHFDPTSNIVDVMIKMLRDKIDRRFEPKLIQTVRGAGYMIEDPS
ncbi:response regulator [Pyrinomonas methylaliphatogenes]|jgi:two-component system copper resistance phosphate regulon response regulator CusR|uniref:Two component transcriptional regulator, winged helix family n=1 Tax=Pyrinomonas methylaliphatogenes TaxID=454194 RepID=A0A0B6WSF8_9BACT|nr:response regulator transcription factor [Pyrinomonas methylaliphatogenes]MBX5479769.1 response regulator transcription factor [Pyrinomonas methylaliphatogenes]CDM64143.1 two component transcriptional regulator, winged helix family [Pyrinomonas methylaliphatogenes]